MRTRHVALVALVLTLARPALAGPEARWQPLRGETAAYDLDLDAFTRDLEGVADEFHNPDDAPPVVVALPLADGTLARFAVYESPVMEPGLAAKYPTIRTYGGVGLDDPTATARFTISPLGLRGIVLGAGGATFVRPRDPAAGRPEYVAAAAESGELQSAVRCAQGASDAVSGTERAVGRSAEISNGQTLRIYKIAASATGEFTEQTGVGGNPGTKETAVATIASVINEVAAIYRKELGVFLDLVANNDAVVYDDKNTDPFTSLDLDCEDTIPACPPTPAPLDCLLTENHCTLNAVIMPQNYDVGIVFDKSVDGGGVGLAKINALCNETYKGRGATAGDFTLLAAHELGHMFGGHHTFNDDTNGACGSLGGSSPRDAGWASEPGSGSTLMSYGGTCQAGDVQTYRDASLNGNNLRDMIAFISAGGGSTCDDVGQTGNAAPVIQALDDVHEIPAQTPFMLDVQAYDPDGDSPLTYAWDQGNVNGTPSPPEGDDGTRPIFRSYSPSTASARSFPSLKYVQDNGNVPPTTWNCRGMGETPCVVGEFLPSTTRTLLFNLTVRDGDTGVRVAAVEIHTNASSGPFKVTYPDVYSSSDCWVRDAWRTVTWDVANTDAFPVQAANVKISLSTDGGATFPYVLAASTPNDGSEAVQVPGVTTIHGRIKVEAVGNVFYDMSDEDFAIRELELSTTADSGCGSLRQAILDANAMSFPGGAVEIPVRLPNQPNVIQVGSQLPTMNTPVRIDGREPAGFVGPPLLAIDGAGAAPNGDNSPAAGLIVAGGDSSIAGVAVYGFDGDGIRIVGDSNTEVAACHVGVDLAGTTAVPNGGVGLSIQGSADNRVHDSVISGNDGDGVLISDASSSGNHVYSNRIGTDPDGTVRIPNGTAGIRVVNAPGNVIGGLAAGEGNVVSGNGRASGSTVVTQADGIVITGAGASGNAIRQNLIGLNAAGDAPLDNTRDGIRIDGAPNTIVGGVEPLAGNHIADSRVLNLTSGDAIDVGGAASGTVIQGNTIGTDVTGSVNLGPRGNGILIDGAPGVEIGGTSLEARNVISGATNSGISLLNGGSATVRGNVIGTNAAGTAAIPNQAYGLWINSAGSTIGGTEPGAGNLISGNAVGMYLYQTAAASNVIQGNLIGTDVTGTQDLGNGAYGILGLRAVNNVIGGATPAARNVVSGNNNSGIYLAGSVGSTAPGNVIQGNYVGTDVTGTVAVGNGAGIRLENVTDVVVGGSNPGEGNLVSGQTAGTGIEVFNGIDVPAAGVLIQGNLVGTDVTGLAKLPNFGNGIASANAGTITIGGTGGAGNVVAGNGQNGISLCCGQGNAVILGNAIGTDAAGTLDLANGYSGIVISTGNGHVVGGVAAGQGNVVAFNSTPGSGTNFAGVKVSFGNGVSVRGNALYGNVGLGIDLGGLGVTANDACDADGGANGQQNFPVLTAATRSGPGTRVEGTLDSTASTAFTLDFYAGESCDPTGYGEGRTYLGSTDVVTDGSCGAAFAADLPFPVDGVVTATATDPGGSTSEFSACAAVAPSPVGEAVPLLWVSPTELTWSPASGATTYRVLRGVLGDLPDVLTVAPDSCERIAGAATTTGPTLTEDPLLEPGRAYWYLVVGSDGTFEGPAGDATGGPRVANPAGACL